MRMRTCFAAALLAAGLIAFTAPARADLLIHVDKSTQQMEVSLDGAPLFVWPVSTGAAGYDTPSGNFKPFRMEAEHFSKEWDDAPMPHSIFFTMKGHAIHGSNHKSIGRPASHGCVRLAPKNAAILFDLVKQEAMAQDPRRARRRNAGRRARRRWRAKISKTTNIAAALITTTRTTSSPAASSTAARRARLARKPGRPALLLLSRTAALLPAAAPLWL